MAVPRASPMTSPTAASSVAPLASLRTTCGLCPLSSACPLPGPPAEPPRQPGQTGNPLLARRQRLLAGQTLVRSGDPFQSLHTVRTGSLKSSLTLADGRRQVAGFHLPGDVVGLDGLADGQHQTTLTALEDSQTCSLVYRPLRDLGVRRPQVQADLHRLMSREVTRLQGHLLVLGSMSAAERLAALLLDLSRRLASRGYSPVEFNLQMSFIDMASYLGITAETVYRTLGAFKAAKLLDVDSRRIRFVDLPAFAHTYSAAVG